MGYDYHVLVIGSGSGETDPGPPPGAPYRPVKAVAPNSPAVPASAPGAFQPGA